MKDFLNNIKYPIAIIVGCLLIGGSLLLVQVNKQNSIEEQKRIEMRSEEKQKTIEAKVEKEKLDFEKQKYEEAQNEIDGQKKLLAYCIDTADETYWDYMRSNGTEDADGIITAKNRHWDIAENNKENDLDSCYKQYK